MARFRWLYPVLLLVMTVGLVNQPRPAVAQECDQIIVDHAELFGARLADVQTAVQRLEDAGAVVRVVTMRDMGQFGNLDQWEADRMRRCPSWQSAEGDRKANLVVLAISMAEKQSLISYGGEWSSVLDEQKVYIRKQVMGPRFKDGEFAQGFINGLDKITDLIKTKSMPQPATPSAPIIVKESGPPLDLSGLWKFMGWALALVAAGLAFVFGLRFFWNLREEQERRAAAQLKAKRIKSACSSLVLEGEQPDSLLNMLHIKLASLASLIMADALKAPKEKLQRILAAVSNAQSGYSSNNTATNDPDNPGRSVAEYNEMTAAYQPIYDALQKAQADLVALDLDIGQLKQRAESAPDHIRQASEAVATTDGELTRTAQLGFRVESMQAILAQAKTALAEAQRALDSHDPFRAIDTAGQVATLCTQVMTASKNLPQRRDKLWAALAKLRDRILVTEQAITNARIVFTAISEKFAPTSWQNINGNGTEAEKRVTLVKEMLDPIAVALAMDKQDWDTAENSIARANERLDAAESMMRSIVALQQHLEAAQTEVPRELEAARNDLAKAVVYEREHDADIDDKIKTQLRDAEHFITKAAAELQKPQPDYLVAGQMTQRANQAADAILDKGRSEVEAAERLRQKAATTLRNAAQAVSTAEEYIEDHSRDVDDARQQLTQAQMALAKANSTKAAASQVTLGEAALAAAQQAQATAESQFEAAEAHRRRVREAAEARRRKQERIEEERREEARRSVIISSPSHHHDYGGWGSGGSSSGGLSIGGGGSSSGGLSIGGGGSSSGGW